MKIPLYSIPHFNLQITVFPTKSAKNGLGFKATTLN